MRNLALFYLFLAAAAVATADPPKVTPVASVTKVDSDIRLEVTADKGKPIGYTQTFADDECLLFRGWSDSPDKMSFLVRPKKPGRWSVVFWTEGERTGAVWTVTAAGEEKKDEKSGPKPDPEPKPKPKYDAVFVAVVEETSARTPETVRVLNDLVYWRTISARGSQWRFYDKDSQEAVSKGYVSAVSGVPLPAMLVLSLTGEKLDVRPLPPSTAGVDQVLKEFTGK